jgi:hypothetical protein
MLIRALLCEHQVMSLGALKASSIASARDVEAKKGMKSFAFRSTFRRSATSGDAFVAKRRKNFNFVEVRLHLNNKNKKNAFLFCIVFDLH